MFEGELTDAMREAIRPFVQGAIFHDLGCGRMHLSSELLRLGAAHVTAVDRHEKQLLPPVPEGVEFVRSHFEHYGNFVENALVSWPVNWESGVTSLLQGTSRIIYLGKNTNNICCGSRSFWRHVLARPVLVHIPNRRNTLIVYGDYMGVTRDPLPEELAAIDQSEVYDFDKIYPGVK